MALIEKYLSLISSITVNPLSTIRAKINKKEKEMKLYDSRTTGLTITSKLYIICF